VYNIHITPGIVSINLILTAAHDLMAPQHYNPEHPEANPSADKRQSCFILLLRVLTMLQSKQALMSAREYQNTWARVLNVDDAQLHDVLFPWMEQTLANGKETLLSVTKVPCHLPKQTKSLNSTYRYMWRSTWREWQLSLPSIRKY